jgi:hypothetical protein
MQLLAISGLPASTTKLMDESKTKLANKYQPYNFSWKDVIPQEN